MIMKLNGGWKIRWVVFVLLHFFPTPLGLFGWTSRIADDPSYPPDEQTECEKMLRQTSVQC